MTPATDGESLPQYVPVAMVQKAASGSLCLVAVGTIWYTAIVDRWAFSALFPVGLALAVQSCRVARENATAFEDLGY